MHESNKNKKRIKYIRKKKKKYLRDKLLKKKKNQPTEGKSDSKKKVLHGLIFFLILFYNYNFIIINSYRPRVRVRGNNDSKKNWEKKTKINKN